MINFNSHMDLRMFGKELTNIIEADPRNRKSYSYIHAEKIKEQQQPLIKAVQHSKQNRSLDNKNDKPSLVTLPTNDPQMVP